MVENIPAESFQKGSMWEFFEDPALANAMEETEHEENLSYEDALKQIKWK